MLDYATELLAACLIGYAIAALMPSWRALLIAILVALLVTRVHSLRDLLFSRIFDGCSALCAGFLLGGPLLVVTKIGFVTGVLIRVLTLLAQARGISLRSTTAIRVAGGLVAPTLLVIAPEVLEWPPWSML
ncbi:hypothetical protein ACQR0Z_10905 [Bradyrhizobium sp. HKCCYLS3077]|uniref:hypothetical protein n=1 Tax=Bradyrhizobium sp. HKCCYLS3077 TaxID=3420761 RepID=UPI003EBFA5EC